MTAYNDSDGNVHNALAMIATYLATFRSCKTAFIAPTTLDYAVNGQHVEISTDGTDYAVDDDPTSASNADYVAHSDAPIQTLAFTARNRPVHAYLEELTRLLGRLDEVDTSGHRMVRERRGAAIREVDAEAQRIEGWTRRVWATSVRRVAAAAEAHERAEAAMRTLTTVEDAYEELKTAFTLPIEVTFIVDGEHVIKDASNIPLSSFDTPSNSLSVNVPPLAFTPSNAPLRRLQEQTLALITRIDETSSNGNLSVKVRKTALINSIENFARQAESWTQSVWISHLQNMKANKGESVPQSSQHIQQMFYALGALDGRFRQLKASFSAPHTLEFMVDDKPIGIDCTAMSASIDVDEEAQVNIAEAPSLAYTPTNIGFRRYNEDIDRIISEIDAVDSAGDISIREKRIQLMKTVQAEVQRLEFWIRRVWAMRPKEACSTVADDVRPLQLSLEELFSGVTKVINCPRSLQKGSLENRAVEVKILPGYKAGTRIRFPHARNQPPDGQASDLVLVVEELPHPRFLHEGNNLIARILLDETSFNKFTGQISLQTLDRRQLLVETAGLPPHSTSVTVVPGEGMPIRRAGAPQGRGDLIVHWDAGAMATPIPPEPSFRSQSSPFIQHSSHAPYHSFPIPSTASWFNAQEASMPFVQPHMQMPYVQSRMSNADMYASPPVANPSYIPPPFPMPASVPTHHLRIVRKGFWNSRGDHLTGDGYIVQAPAHLANPQDLRDYPPPARGFADHCSDFRWYSPNQRIHPDTISWDGRPPRRTYESVSEFTNSSPCVAQAVPCSSSSLYMSGARPEQRHRSR